MAVEQSVATPSASPQVTGKSCHQCRQYRGTVAACTNSLKNRLCGVKICSKCLLNRYGEKAEEVATLEQWSCPKCRGICNCSICMKRKGHQPTGRSIHTAKATGFSSVSEMLLKSAERSNSENDNADMTADLETGVDFSSKGKENSFAGKVDVNFQNLEENPKKIKRGRLDVDKQKDARKPKKLKREGLDENGDGLYPQPAELPVGTDLTSVADIDMRAEDVGNALQYLEFCSAFEKIVDVRKGEAECILEDVLKGQPVRRGKTDVTVQFHMRLLSIIQTDQGKKCATYGSWFNMLKKCLSESKHISKDPVVVSLEKAADYEALSATEKLRILNLLCDEVLQTQKARNWINDQNSQFRQKAKEAKLDLLNAKRKDTLVSDSKSEPAQACEQSLELKGALLMSNQECDAMRTKPILVDNNGRVYWKLNCVGKLDVLHQDVGKGDTLTLDEKWFTVSNEGTEIIEKYISSLRRK